MMKQLLLLGLMAWLIATLQACEFTEPPPAELKENKLRASSSVPTKLVAEDLMKSDTIVEGDTLITITGPAILSMDTVGQITRIDRLRKLGEPTIEPSEMELLLPTFAGKDIGESMALLFPIHQDTLQLYVDYFDGDLIGSKVFYIAAGELLAVDVIKLEEYWTEGGKQVKSILTHSFYYHKNQLLYCKAFHHSEEQEILDKENTQNWAIIQPQLLLL
ncbi:MAG: hypothetical protein ACRBFS_03015 [Aureispira sp.]